MKKIKIILIMLLLVSSSYAVMALSKNDFLYNHVESIDEYDLLIIAPDDFSNEIQPLIDHKNSYEVKTYLITTDEIYSEFEGRDDAEKIKYYIKYAIESYNIKYVLLIGGRVRQSFKWYIPPRYSKLDDDFIDKEFLSDLYYADIYKENGDFEDWDGNENDIFGEWGLFSGDKIDLKPDISLGRLPCRNKNEVEDIVNKIIYYEENSHDSSWLKKILLVGGDTNPNMGDPFPYEGEAACDWLIQYLEGFSATKLYVSDNTLSNPSDFISEFNKGYGLVCYHGHGLTDRMETYYPDSQNTVTLIYNSNVSELNNNGMYPVMVVGCCLTTCFDVSIFDFLLFSKNKEMFHNYNILNFRYRYVSDCISWNMVKKSDGGSIAHIGSSSTAYGFTGDSNLDEIPDSVQNGMTSGLCNEFFRIYGEEEERILGNIYSEALSNIIVDYSGRNDKLQCKCIQEFQLIGDPSLLIGGYP